MRFLSAGCAFIPGKEKFLPGNQILSFGGEFWLNINKNNNKLNINKKDSRYTTEAGGDATD